MIYQVKDYEAVLTYSPINEMTGHIFECFDYYLRLRIHFKTCILFMTTLSKQDLKVCFESKYSVPFEEIEQDLLFIDYNNLPNIISFPRNAFVLLTDGNIYSLQGKKMFLSTKNLYGFMCYDYNFKNVKMNNQITYLQDYRIYGKHKYFKSIDYVKKIPFDLYKKVDRSDTSTALFYVTFVCRKVNRDTILEGFLKSGCEKGILLVPQIEEEFLDIHENIQVLEMPLPNLMERFDTYIYTNVERQFDCSSRLVTECAHYGKKVIFDIDYTDIALETRKQDCKDIQKLNLTDDDSIIQVIKDVIRKK